MLNELYTFAEPVQVVPFSSLKWGKFTLLHTYYRWSLHKCVIFKANLQRNLYLSTQVLVLDSDLNIHKTSSIVTTLNRTFS